MGRHGAAAAALPAILFLAACSTLPGQPAAPSALAARPFVANFTAAGRVAARLTGDDKRGFSGGFNWTHQPAQDVVELLTPLGQIAARLTMTVAVTRSGCARSPLRGKLATARAVCTP